MALLAKNPEEVKPSKPKFMISGEAKVGKTLFSLQFPKPYFIDVEGGGVREQYTEALKKSGGVYMGKDEGSQDFDIVINQVKELTQTKHPYKTLIIDSFTWLYLLEAAEAEEKGGSEYGRDKKEANKPTRQLIRALEKIDMSVILICHSKQEWKKIPGSKERELVGTTFDGFEKLNYIYDLWLEILKGGRAMLVRGSRISNIKEGDSFPATYDKFSELYGKDIIEREAVPLALATPEQIGRINNLIVGLKIEPDTIDKWFKKCNVESFLEMSGEQIQSLIAYCEKKVMELSMVKK